MLTLTQNAVEAIRSLAAPHGEEGGLRIVAGGNQASALQLSLTPEPAAGDEIVEAGGARVFMEPAAAHVLSDKALDAAVDDDGGVAFSLAHQAS